MGTHPQIKKLEYNYITNGIYVGTSYCCITHFEESLMQEGIEVDVSLEAERIDSPFGVDFYLWLPVENDTAPSPDQLEAGVASLEKFIQMGKKIYVHCMNGHGRAPTLVAAYLIESKGSTVEEAVEFIRGRRPTIHLNNVQQRALQAFANSQLSTHDS